MKISGRTIDQTQAFREIVIRNWGASRERWDELAREAGVELAKGSMNGAVYHTRQTIELLTQIHGIEVPTPGAKPAKKAKTAASATKGEADEPAKAARRRQTREEPEEADDDDAPPPVAPRRRRAG